MVKKIYAAPGGPRDGSNCMVSEPKTGKHNSEGTIDGELYFVTALLFASNRCVNNTV
jgi:oligosaccharide reducing-end xylanase